MTSLLLGLFLGVTHALDPDHLVAVSTLTSESKDLRQSSVLGILWGLGHTMALLLIGGVMLNMKWVIPDHWALGMEVAVGIMIVLLGLHLLARSCRTITIHGHPHSHDGTSHVHLHIHEDDTVTHQHHILGSKPKALAIGFVHGVAGSAALSLAVMSTMPSILLGIMYLGVFGVGSIVGMLGMSLVVSVPFVVAPGPWQQWMKLSAGLFAVGFGGYMTWSFLG